MISKIVWAIFWVFCWILLGTIFERHKIIIKPVWWAFYGAIMTIIYILVMLLIENG
jgi:hypothetical protein